MNLEKMKDSEFFRSVENIHNEVSILNNTKVDEILNEFDKSKKIYEKVLLGVDSKIFLKNGHADILRDFINEYNELNRKINEIKSTFNETVLNIKNAINEMLIDKVIKSLREVPVEELARNKCGIRVKCLRNAGYNNLANIFDATSAQIASVYGISQNQAYIVKDACDNYARNLYKGMKIKLSTDEKTKTSTKVICEIYKHLKLSKCIRQLEKLEKIYGNNFKTDFKAFDEIGNGIKILFLSNEELESFKTKYKNIKDNLLSIYKINVLNIYNDYKKITTTNSKECWNDFSINPISYYNIIEKVCPDALGNDDSVYGIPEELATQIQDECFYSDGLLCTLRKYQEWGVKYILHQGRVLLGDEMGLGKTIQAIATMVSLKNAGATHFLVICPASVVTNWCREITKHSKLRVTKIHGSYKKIAFEEWMKQGDVAVTNYESTSYIELAKDFRISLLVVDEAHYIKNPSSIRSINSREIATHADRLLFMTGTALENNVDEMLSLINILNHNVALEASALSFMSSAPMFKKKIAPVYYRRKREDVLMELPNKIENEEWCTLGPEEEIAYEEAVLNKQYSEARRVSWNIKDLNLSCKAKRLKEIVVEAEAEGRKILIFSFFLDTISKIYDFLKGRCLQPINGSVSPNRRQEIIDEFDKSPAGTVLLAQITSGGTGLNIQSASVVVICEPQFKPSIENQAISRAYRMGQARNVLVYRLLCENTIDERLTEILKTKQDIFNAFADESVAAQQNNEINEKMFGNIINKEIERINIKHGIVTDSD